MIIIIIQSIIYNPCTAVPRGIMLRSVLLGLACSMHYAFGSIETAPGHPEPDTTKHHKTEKHKLKTLILRKGHKKKTKQITVNQKIGPGL